MSNPKITRKLRIQLYRMFRISVLPVCRPAQHKVYGVARHETVRVACELEANPTDVQFVWKFNNTSDLVDIAQSEIQTEKTRSVASYKPVFEADYGTLLCWGRNEIGMQKEPCVFYINPAGKPDDLSNCTIVNQTADSLHVECSEGFDGGVPQEFIMEVFDTQTRKLVGNVTSRSAVFDVGGLESGAGFEIGLYAANRKGRSKVTHLQAFTLKSAEKHTGERLILPSNAAAHIPIRQIKCEKTAKVTKPLPPENCTVALQTRSLVQVKCQVVDLTSSAQNTYLMQVYDAHTRLLLGTATSQNPEDVTVADLPPDHKDLLLFVRTMDSRSIASDANIIYAPAVDNTRSGASTPVLLQITPLLGALIGVVAALILVAVVIVAVIRLRSGADRDDKDYDDGGLSSAGRRCVAGGGGGDKASTEPLNKDLNDSVDSLEEKNPDIIPQNNAEDEYQDEERAFERLNNAALRAYGRVQSPNGQSKKGTYDGYGPKMVSGKPRGIDQSI
ncbi:hypothetical protein NQ318_017598, partial [Aromia moschata]